VVARAVKSFLRVNGENGLASVPLAQEEIRRTPTTPSLKTSNALLKRCLS